LIFAGESVFMSRNLLRDLRVQWLAVALVLALATIVVYHQTLSFPFHLDSSAHILNFPEAKELTWNHLKPRSRRLVDLSWSLNRSLSGTSPVGYRVVNIAIHIASSVALFGFLYVTLARYQLSEAIRGNALLLSAGIALVWTVHPLQTQSVTYTVQRYESLMGLFFLLSMLSFAVGHGSRYRVAWNVACLVFCFAAVLCKEVAVVLPLVILWYDRAFVSESWKGLVRSNWLLYLALLASWLIFWPIWNQSPKRLERVGVVYVDETVITETGPQQRTVGPVEYLYSQAKVIPFYLWLSVVPHAQSLDHGWRATFSFSQAVVPGLFVLSLIGLTLWAAVRNPLLGFWGAWFFLILAPTSSILPIQDIAFEHRMYLPLAGVVSVLVLGCYQAVCRAMPHLRTVGGTYMSSRVLGTLILLAVVSYGISALARNEVYRSSEAMWQDVIYKNPQHFRGYSQLANVHLSNGDIDTALPLLTKAIELYPTTTFTEAHATTFYEKGMAELAAGNLDRAMQCLNIAVRGNQNDDRIYIAIAKIEQSRNPARAEAFLRKAVELNPANSEAYNRLASLVQRYDRRQAIALFRKSIEVAPENAHAHNNLANAYARQKQWSAAIRHYQVALSLHPDFQTAAENLATVRKLQKASAASSQD